MNTQLPESDSLPTAKPAQAPNDLKVTVEEEIREGVKTGVLKVTIDGVPYRVNEHQGMDAMETAFQVNKLFAPRQLRLAELQDQLKASPETLAEIKRLEEVNPEEADLMKRQMASDNAPFTRAMAESWDRLDRKEEAELYRLLFKYTGGPFGNLNDDMAFNRTFKGRNVRHMRPLRDIVIAHNAFSELMDSIL